MRENTYDEDRSVPGSGAWVWRYTYWHDLSRGVIFYRHLNERGAWNFFCYADDWRNHLPAKKGIKPNLIPL